MVFDELVITYKEFLNRRGVSWTYPKEILDENTYDISIVTTTNIRKQVMFCNSCISEVIWQFYAIDLGYPFFDNIISHRIIDTDKPGIATLFEFNLKEIYKAIAKYKLIN